MCLASKDEKQLALSYWCPLSKVAGNANYDSGLFSTVLSSRDYYTE